MLFFLKIVKRDAYFNFEIWNYLAHNHKVPLSYMGQQPIWLGKYGYILRLKVTPVFCK